MRQQTKARTTYVASALGPPYSPQYMTTCTRGFATLLPTLWRIPWENGQKEVLWRLAADGVGGTSARTKFSCPCCPAAPPDGDPRLHSFWTCPVAVAVRDTIQTSLTTFSPQATPLQRGSLWLCSPYPCSTLDGDVWRVVCLAALSAMDHGRRQLWRLSYVAAAVAPPRDPSQRTLYEVWDLPPPAPSQPSRSIADRAGALAVADFWSRIADFVDVCDPPTEWDTSVGTHHPFISHGGTRVNMGTPILPLPDTDDPPSDVASHSPSSPRSLSPPPQHHTHTHLAVKSIHLPESWPYT